MKKKLNNSNNSINNKNKKKNSKLNMNFQVSRGGLLGGQLHLLRRAGEDLAKAGEHIIMLYYIRV